ncbi:DEAD/DEAH box helicase [Epilithonimonas sp.]|uniref:DEAD/DEAH box helicase n=1 Tax=Epilithonimonas sp. TaxID=2894511 RepID=UPI00289F049A|nr:DEAD/DEAH box helicase [Epilithonimonas sp.]
MYNSITEAVIRTAPQIDGSETENLPQYLTKIYARIVSVRRKLDGSRKISKTLRNDIAELRKLANNLESLTVLNKNGNNIVSAAFVAGTAHNLLQLIRDQKDFASDHGLETHNVPSWISSILLFLIGDSPADAAEIAGRMTTSSSGTIQDQLAEAIRLLANGQLGPMRAIQPVSKEYSANEIDIEAEDYLWTQLLSGLQQMAEVLMGMKGLETNYFKKVIQLAMHDITSEGLAIKSCYSGPYHLALLLDVLQDRLLTRGVINVDPPSGIDPFDWIPFLQKLAGSRPYLWENHFNAVQTGFLNSGNSAVLTFPTGAGKTTVAELKIASTMMAGRSVLYLVPTHALEDQINRDLTTLFDNMNADILEIGSEFTDFDNHGLETINVMTPERCLTLLAMNPEHFENIGLVVFDEFHLVNARMNRLDKRSLDAMYCLLRLFAEVPESDYLLISAMVENGEEIASWVSSVTGRNCEVFNSSWKPTRQLQGCVIYPQQELDELKKIILAAHVEKPNGGPPKKLKDQIYASPYQIFSLRNIWDEGRPNDFFVRKLLNKKIKLELSPYWGLTSNRNQVAAELAVHFVRSGIKTLVFVSNPIVAKSTARNLNAMLDERVMDLETFATHNESRMRSLELELGDLKYSYFSLENQVAAHHGLLLPAERQLNELLFKYKDGIHAIVATATLAQGINLTAEVVIIAGDDRFDEDTEGSEKLLAHEILNAAGRAGRAGMAAQGVVIIVPGQIISFENRSMAPENWRALQQRIFSKSDQCLTINDPMTRFIDEVIDSDENELLSQDLNSLLLRLNNDETEKTSIKTIFNNSFAAYKANQEGNSSFSQKIDELIRRRDSIQMNQPFSDWVESVSLKTGIDPTIIEQLGNSLDDMNLDILFNFTVPEWISWFFNWLEGNRARILEIFPGNAARAQIARALGLKVSKYNLDDLIQNISAIDPILKAFVNGDNYQTIDNLIPGRTDEHLTKARHFILRLVPQISFAIGVVSLTLKEFLLSLGFDQEEIPFVVGNLPTLIREGLDTEEKLRYKMIHRRMLRVEIHQAFS